MYLNRAVLIFVKIRLLCNVIFLYNLFLGVKVLVGFSKRELVLLYHIFNICYSSEDVQRTPKMGHPVYIFSKLIFVKFQSLLVFLNPEFY